jgi:alkylated DNA repair dioxygenase AlkB
VTRRPRSTASSQRCGADEHLFDTLDGVVALQGTLLGDGDPRLDPSRPFERVTLDDRSWVDVCRGWLAGADSLFESLAATVPWRQRRRWMYDRMVDEPRLTCAYGRRELPHPVLDDVHAELDRRYESSFGSVFLNYYRDGHDSVAFHRDRELRHEGPALIAILTLGGVRPFLLRPHGSGRSVDVRPASGDLLVMRGRTHCDWEHGVPKVASCGPRISVSLRVGMR